MIQHTTDGSWKCAQAKNVLGSCYGNVTQMESSYGAFLALDEWVITLFDWLHSGNVVIRLWCMSYI
jgi:hypothetical protein